MSKSIRFYLDYLSGYSYVAWTQIHALAARHGAIVEPVPVLFAGMAKAHGTKVPLDVPARRTYILKDLIRTAKVLGIPFEPPPVFPFNPLLPLRVSSVDLPPDALHRLVDAIFRAVWAGGPGAADEQVVASVADRAGLDGQALVAQAREPATKERLHLQTEGAVRLGVFGVPTMAIGGELFWGFDSFGHLERTLRGEDPLDLDLLQRWSKAADAR